MLICLINKLHSKFYLHYVPQTTKPFNQVELKKLVNLDQGQFSPQIGLLIVPGVVGGVAHVHVHIKLWRVVG